MPLRQIGTTDKDTFPPREGHGIPYAFAVRIRHTTFAGGVDHVIIRCPWCGCEHPVEVPEPTCPDIGRRYTVAIPAGTPAFA